ncbi:hypothetical protein NPA31_011845 [Aurantimonas sp. MSK8Z-1]|uniref:hypothetical protein n=1 Tax=Mangrovibrevibacter kandeliae TaxID=2968473 RepID=UPI002117C99E|nr:hypothetical protein [Aurantimonas sp. MSK8Z-1]MCW4115656.1 hypothetical protein [Aurantimonas sp. MSK8Z-1]
MSATTQRRRSVTEIVREAWPIHEQDARRAYALFTEHCGGSAPGRVPGMDTLYRLAVRLHCGRSIEEAAAREYLYRWHLALRSPIFGVPHALGA